MPSWIEFFNVIAFCLWMFQLVFAFLFIQRTKRLNKKTIEHTPFLSVVIPIFNEANEIVQRVIDSATAQRGVEIEIFVIDDGSENPIQIQSHPKVQFIRLDKNMGKRHAQIHAVHQSSCDWIVTVDSDTFLHPDAISELYKSAILNKCDCVTGNIKLLNEKQNLLTRMVSCLYWYGFSQERASQSYFKEVTCCSGALSLFKKDTFLKSADLYLNQKFLGNKCIAGDDRFLTCLFALNGKHSVCSLNAIAYTISPPDFMGFLRQQLRWSRSYTPAFIFTIKESLNISRAFMLFMLAVAFRYSYFAALYILFIACIASGNFIAPLYILLTILLVSGIKAFNAFLYTRKLSMFYLMPLSILALFVLSPVVIYGIFTPTSTGWLTRKKGRAINQLNISNRA